MKRMRSQPDDFFTEQQRARLELLMAKWRDGRDHDLELLPAEQAELEALIETEVNASVSRVAAGSGLRTQ